MILKEFLNFLLNLGMDAFEGIVQFAEGQIDCIECQKHQKVLNEDIIKLKNFVAKHKPQQNYAKTIAAHRQYEQDLKEWDGLMRL